MLAELPDMDPSRLHFAGLLPYTDYLTLLRASSAHVYLTVPFCLSWSLLEAMAVGCPIVASDTAPVREVAEDGRNGLASRFLRSCGVGGAGRASCSTGRPLSPRCAPRRGSTVEQRYALVQLLPRQLQLLQDIVRYGRPADRLRPQRRRPCPPPAGLGCLNSAAGHTMMSGSRLAGLEQGEIGFDRRGSGRMSGAGRTGIAAKTAIGPQFWWWA